LDHTPDIKRDSPQFHQADRQFRQIIVVIKRTGDFSVERLAKFTGVEVSQVELIRPRAWIAHRKERPIDRNLDDARFGRFTFRTIELVL
jgi:hypothetical protein